MRNSYEWLLNEKVFVLYSVVIAFRLNLDCGIICMAGWRSYYMNNMRDKRIERMHVNGNNVFYYP